MEETAYDYEVCRRVWNRVSPMAEPYPAQEVTLPGAQEDPCCMGTEALESVEVLRGFVREEMLTQRRLRELSQRCTNTQARRCFALDAALCAQRVKKLRSALYLITGEEYRAEVPFEKTHYGGYCAMLRALYHDAACSGFNYARAAEEATDSCLSSLLGGFSQEEYRRAEQILDLLAKAL